MEKKEEQAMTKISHKKRKKEKQRIQMRWWGTKRRSRR